MRRSQHGLNGGKRGTGRWRSQSNAPRRAGLGGCKQQKRDQSMMRGGSGRQEAQDRGGPSTEGSVAKVGGVGFVFVLFS